MPKRFIDIKKEKGHWVAKRDHRNKPYRRDTAIEWRLHPDPDDPKKLISAHFQFTDLDLVEDEPGRNELTPHLTAVIPKPRKKLQVKIPKNADRRLNPRHYAIWIRDDTHPDGGSFALCERLNPPPEMDVGG